MATERRLPHHLSRTYYIGTDLQLDIADESGKTQPKWHNNQAKASFLNPEIAPLEAVVVAAIPHMDLAVLKLKHLPQDLDSKVLRFSKIPPKIDDLCFSIGHQYIEHTIRMGVVSSPIRYHAHFRSGVFESFFNPVVDGFYVMEVDMNVGPAFMDAPLLSPDAEVIGNLPLPKIPLVPMPELANARGIQCCFRMWLSVGGIIHRHGAPAACSGSAPTPPTPPRRCPQPTINSHEWSRS
ncbi:hypothetical protein RHSIM_Rhsim02G0107400 [Rhododendron simsii]|uniref:Uncharacterized protein n=1 Tax=Rhododendron simsii TaxID=118357 RepID=A0A834HA27_RHOSS|nr:hypothetical protein RHSIM_Rhsim02G0107400 [Rhododendron simsii]